jgi:hypothetical protein
MICVKCDNPAKLSANGLCGRCRKLAHKRCPRRLAEINARARQWGDPHYDEVRLRLGMDPHVAIRRAATLYKILSQRFERRTIIANALDNPYMQEHARKVLINDLAREKTVTVQNQRRRSLATTIKRQKAA